LSFPRRRESSSSVLLGSRLRGSDDTRVFRDALLIWHEYISKRRSGLARENPRATAFAGKPAPTINSCSIRAGSIRQFALLAFVVLGGCSQAAETEFLPSREWGTMELYRPDAATGEVLLMFSGAGGIAAQDRKAAQRMLAEGRTVALVDGGAVLRGAKAASGACLELSAIGQWLSQSVQQGMGAEDFRAAVLLGRDEGAWVVHSLLAQAAPGVFKAGLSVNFKPGNPSGCPLCGVGAVAADRRIAPDTPLNGLWAVADTHALRFDAARYARQAASASGQGEPWLMSGADYAELASRFMRWVNALHALRHGAKTVTTALPLVELPAQISNTSHAFKDVSVLFISGDGGWRDIDQQVGRVLANNGLHVLGVDALRYFWRKRTPESVAADFSALLEKPAIGQGATRFPVGHRLLLRCQYPAAGLRASAARTARARGVICAAIPGIAY